MCERCAKRLNKMLVEHNTVLDQTSLINFKTGKVRASVVIASRRLNRGGKKPKVILPSFCPFCGKPETPKRKVA